MTADPEKLAELAEMESLFEIRAGDYSDPEKLALRLAKAKREIPTEALIGGLVEFYLTLEVTGRQVGGLAILLADLGAIWRDLDHPELLHQRISARLRGIAPIVAMSYRLAIHRALYRTQRPELSCRLFELASAIGRDDFRDRPKLVEKIGRLQSGLPRLFAVQFLQVVLLTYEACFRNAEIAAILEALIGIDHPDYQQPRSLCQRLDFYFRDDLASLRGQLTGALAATFVHRNQPASARALILASWGLVESDLDDEEALAGRLARRFAQYAEMGGATDLPLEFLESLQFVIFIVGLGEDSELDRGRRLAGVLARLLKQRAGEADPLLLVQAAAKHILGIGADRHEPIWKMAFSILQSALEEPEEVARRGEQNSGLTDEDFRSVQILATKLQELFPSEAIPQQVVFLLSVEEQAERAERVQLLCRAYVEHLAYLNRRTGHLSAYAGAIIGLHLLWLRLFGYQDRDRFLSVCAELIPFLRQTFQDFGVELTDRLGFIARVEELRQAILEAGAHWIGEERDFSRARRLVLDVLLWETELSQRALLERLLRRDEEALPAAPPATSRWPLSTEEKPQDDWATFGFVGFLEPADPPPGAGPEEKKARADHSAVALRRDLERLIELGATEAGIASALGETGILVRATFDPAGQIRWSAVASDGSGLAVLGYGHSKPGSLERLRAAVAWHDFEAAFLRQAGQGSSNRAAAFFHQASSTLDATLEKLQAALARPGIGFGNWSRELAAEVHRLEAAGGSVLGGMLRLAAYGFVKPEEDDAEDRWKVALNRQLGRCRNLLATRPGPVQARAALDRVTANLLAEVSAIWSLEGLIPFLSSETDLVFQVDDAFHAVPLAYLPVGDQPLCRQVSSLRTSWSLLFESLQQHEELNFRQGPEPAGILALSYFPIGDDASGCAVPFHRGQKALAELHQKACWRAGDVPPGSAGTLSRALVELGPLAAVSVCGHGHRQDPGVSLSDGLWRGQGCDFSKVGMLLLVSCSLGRIEQTGDRDVGGFSVELAVHHARSVLSCRWPVSAGAAVKFAEQVLGAYLTALEGGESGKLRSRALNSARLALLGSPSQPGVGLHTAAAFELYGLG